MTGINELIQGYKRFYHRHFIEDSSLYDALASKGQSPRTLVISCSDSRVDPSIIMDANPGDIFVIRNVANIVPPYQPKADSYHGTSAALEFAVCNLGVKHIVVMGHSGCAGIRSLYFPPEGGNNNGFSFIRSWVRIADEAKDIVEKAEPKADLEHKITCCERENVRTSLKNLLTFPFVSEYIESKKLDINGWYFSIHNGQLDIYNNEEDKFEVIGV